MLSPLFIPLLLSGGPLPGSGGPTDGAAGTNPDSPSIMGRRKTQEQPPSDPVSLPQYHLKRNAFSWSESAHMVYLEQPIRTGFSKAAAGAHNIDNEDEVASDFFKFMQSLLTVFPEYQGLPVYITGIPLY